MNVLITGSNGFIASHLINYINKKYNYNLYKISRNSSYLDLCLAIDKSDFICHLAGVNRADNISEFRLSNVQLTQDISSILTASRNIAPIYFSSSIHCDRLDNYGVTKLAAEDILNNLNKVNGNKVFIHRLSRVYGPGAKPNYNSVIATYCYNITNDLPIFISNPHHIIEIIYIDDLLKIIDGAMHGYNIDHNIFVNKISLSDLSDLIFSFKKKSNYSGNIDSKLVEKIRTTYLSYYNV